MLVRTLRSIDRVVPLINSQNHELCATTACLDSNANLGAPLRPLFSVWVFCFPVCAHQYEKQTSLYGALPDVFV